MQIHDDIGNRYSSKRRCLAPEGLPQTLGLPRCIAQAAGRLVAKSEGNKGGRHLIMLMADVIKTMHDTTVKTWNLNQSINLRS